MADFFEHYLRGVQLKAYQSQLDKDAHVEQAMSAFHGVPQPGNRKGWLSPQEGEAYLNANDPAYMERRQDRALKASALQTTKAKERETKFLNSGLQALDAVKNAPPERREPLWNELKSTLHQQYPEASENIDKVDITDDGIEMGRAAIVTRLGGDPNAVKGGGSPKAVIGPDGNPIYVSPKDSVGKQPAPGRESVTPANVQEYQFFQGLPKEKQQEYLMVKRANQMANVGGVETVVAPGTPAGPVAPLEQVATNKAALAASTAQGTIEGEASGAASVKLPKLESDAVYMTDLLDKLVSHPGLPYAVGATSMLPIAPGTDAAGFKAIYDQINGKRFLEAYEQLKGGGAITTIEGTKGEQAISRMNTATSEEEFKAAAKDFQKVIVGGLKHARKMAKGDMTPSAVEVTPTGRTATNPQTGEKVQEMSDGTWQ